MWQEPKTDWYGQTLGGQYTGDRFNAVDYNRIKNNIVFLRDLAVSLYHDFNIQSLPDKTVTEYFYADEINTIENNFKLVVQNTLSIDYGTAPVYVDNGPTPDFVELNRLESAILDLYIKMTTQRDSRRMFTWNFGIKEGF